MKTAIIFSEGTKQINFTAENDDEKLALRLITANDDIKLAVKPGSFMDKGNQPFTVDIANCQAGYLRAFTNTDSIMLVLTPKPKKVISSKTKNNYHIRHRKSGEIFGYDNISEGAMLNYISLRDDGNIYNYAIYQQIFE